MPKTILKYSSQELALDLPQIINTNLRQTTSLTSVADLISKEGNEIDYSPFYQRKYVWNVTKASFFIESLLLNAEIPPLIMFRSGNCREIIDGRQRYETILRFIKKDFKLSIHGLTKLKHLAGKDIDTLDEEHISILNHIQLRVYEYELHKNSEYPEEIEMLLKQEIFNRYNSGITPLTQLEIFRAKYIDDLLNGYFKYQIIDDEELLNKIAYVYGFKSKSVELLLRRTRTLLVLHHIPIHVYSNKRDPIYQLYDHFSSLIKENSGIENIFKNFKSNIEWLNEVKISLDELGTQTNVYLSQSLFWALSICKKEGIQLEHIYSPAFRKKTVQHIVKNNRRYNPNDIRHDYQVMRTVFNATADFFSTYTNIDFDNYLLSTKELKKSSDEMNEKLKEQEVALISAQTSYLKKELTSSRLSTLVDLIQKNKFNIRPHYQRDEVITRSQSSSIIESLLLGIELPPIFIYKRKNGQSEVIDGQQRILSCIAYLGCGEIVKSNKNHFALQLKGSILEDLHGKRFRNLEEDLQRKILNATIRVVEISEEHNPNFDPVDLFMRLNFKPYPIKENTFESWNSFLDRRLTDRIKRVESKHNEWFYISRKNDRMQNEELITNMLYFQINFTEGNRSFKSIEKLFAIYFVRKHLQVRLLNKNGITKSLTALKNRDVYISLCDELEHNFLAKLRYILSGDATAMSEDLNLFLDSKNETQNRSAGRLYALWVLFAGVSVNSFENFTAEIKQDVRRLMTKMQSIRRVEGFKPLIETFWKKYESL